MVQARVVTLLDRRALGAQGGGQDPGVARLDGGVAVARGQEGRRAVGAGVGAGLGGRQVGNSPKVRRVTGPSSGRKS
jgi:hypothetical protein